MTVLGLTLSGPIAAKTMEDFHFWNNVSLTGSLGAINPALKNVKYLLEGIGRFGLMPRDCQKACCVAAWVMG